MFSGWLVKLTAFGGVLLGIGLAIWKAVSMGKKLEKADQMEEANEAREKMDSVPDSSSSDTVDSLRDEKF